MTALLFYLRGGEEGKSDGGTAVTLEHETAQGNTETGLDKRRRWASQGC